MVFQEEQVTDLWFYTIAIDAKQEDVVSMLNFVMLKCLSYLDAYNCILDTYS